MLSPSLEDYLEEIYNLSFLKIKIRVNEIAKRLNVSPPSTVRALKKLNEEGFLIYSKYSEIKLTEKGFRLGELLVRRNTVLRDFLKIIGSNCDVVEEAEAMEHYLSSTTISSIETLIAFLKVKEVRDMYQRFSDSSYVSDWSRAIESKEIK
jgi:DtxR family transcriptional regulator, Mn-dependent transcriptional regulator